MTEAVTDAVTEAVTNAVTTKVWPKALAMSGAVTLSLLLGLLLAGRSSGLPSGLPSDLPSDLPADGSSEYLAVDVNLDNVSSSIDPDEDYFLDDSMNTYDWWEVVPTLIVYPLIMVLGLAGNALIIFTTQRYRRMQSTTNVFLSSLASADLLLIIVCIPVKVSGICAFAVPFSHGGLYVACSPACGSVSAWVLLVASREEEGYRKVETRDTG